jgi:hypothetical protein
VPTTDGRELVLTRYTQPEPELQLLIQPARVPIAASATTQDHRNRPSQPTLP